MTRAEAGVTGTNEAVKSLMILAIGFAAGFVAAAILYEADTKKSKDADALVSDLERRFESLEVEPAS